MRNRTIDRSVIGGTWWMTMLAMAASASALGGDIRINEVRIDQAGADDDEYFELAGPSGASLDGLTYVVIGDGAGGSGVIEVAADLTGNAIGAGGFFVAAESTFTIGVADLVTSLSFENSDNVTHLLVSDFSGMLGEDLDADDDGTLDVTPWSAIIDCVSLIESVGSGDQVYCATTVGPDGTFVPGHVYLCVPDGTWSIGAFDVADGTDTPGAENLACIQATGACCLDNGDCTDGTTASECNDLGGAYQDDDSDCGAVVCVPVTGACCYDTGLCDDGLTAEACAGGGGSYEGDGLTCGDVSCPQPPAACCFADGTCQVLAEEDCAATDGAFVGGDCADANCTAVDAALSEIRIDQPGGDDDEYFELSGTPGSSLDGVTYLVIGDSSLGSGVIENVTSLSGQSIGASGFFVAAMDSFALGTADLVTSLSFENSDNVTHMIVSGFSGGNGDDLDTDDDGVLDVTPWTSIIDCVGLVESVGSGDQIYCDATVGPDGNFVPAHAYLCVPLGLWTIGPFDPDGGDDTPGAPNAFCVIDASVDIKPGSCPNSFNRNSNGVLPVALLGAANLDASEVDLSTIAISRADGVGGSVGPIEGPPGPHSVVDDVASPFVGESCDCHELEGDGIDDLSMKFRSQDVVDVLQLDDLPPGDLVELVITASLNDGTIVIGGDCIRLVPPGTQPGMVAVQTTAHQAYIEVSPLDLQLDGGGFGSFVRTYPLGSVVTLTAEAHHLGAPFLGWTIRGGFVRTTDRRLPVVILDSELDVMAVYGSAPAQPDDTQAPTGDSGGDRGVLTPN